MKPVRSVALIGLGAIGTLYAAKIVAREPAALRIIAAPDRITRYRTDPPSFNGTSLDLNYVSPWDPGEPADLILVAVKSTDLPSVFVAITPFISDTTQVLPLLNGITAQDSLAKAFGWPRVLHGFVYCASSMRTGHAVVQSGKNKIVFGEATNSPPAPRVRAIGDFFERLEIPYDIPADMVAAQWRKFILNIGINQAQGVLRTTNKELQENPESMQLARNLMDEAAAVAAAVGIPDAHEIPSWGESVIRASRPDNRTSMLQDVQAGRPNEVELFAGTLCRLGRQYGINTPANDMALLFLRDS